MKAKNVMTQRVFTTRPENSVRNAALTMLSKNVSGLPVLDDEEKLVGIVTEGDLLRRIAGGRGSAASRSKLPSDADLSEFVRINGWSVEDAMSKAVVTVDPETTTSEIASTMVTRAIKRVPVVSEGRLLGIVSRCDLLVMVAEAPFDIVATDDEGIRTALVTRMKNDLGLDMDMDRIAVTVRQRQVFIEGRLDSPLQRKAMEALIESIRAIEAFTDRTQILYAGKIVRPHRRRPNARDSNTIGQ